MFSLIWQHYGNNTLMWLNCILNEFWIEYTGIAKIGIDMSEVDMKISENNITITMPKAKLLNIDILDKSLNDDSYIVTKDGLLKNKITAEDQTDAINSAQLEMEKSVKSNKTLLINAQDRAKKLIETYIKKLCEISRKEYQIKWVYEK